MPVWCEMVAAGLPLSPMTDPTSDEDDLADYTDDQQDAPKSDAVGKAQDSRKSIGEMTPDVQGPAPIRNRRTEASGRGFREAFTGTQLPGKLGPQTRRLGAGGDQVGLAEPTSGIYPKRLRSNSGAGFRKAMLTIPVPDLRQPVAAGSGVYAHSMIRCS